ncbi:MAG: DinB family protein [Ginsengibacter sp.]
MKKSLDIIRGARTFLINLIDGISIEKLNEIPPGFNNNLVWNLGHVIANQQIICYLNAGVAPLVEEQFINKYKTGTKPEGFIDEAEFTVWKGNLLSTIDKLEEDVAAHKFENYKLFVLKSYAGLRIENINDAIKFISFHDGLHVGYSMALKRHLENNGFGK